MKKVATIKDIASMSGVSITTVSRVLNGVEGACAPQTEVRIREAIEKLGYRPNSIARSLVTKRTYMVGLIIPDVCNLYFQEFAKGAEQVCRKRGYGLLVCSANSSIKREENYLHSLSEGIADGIIVTTQNVKDKNNGIIKDLNEEGYPIVTVERYGKDLEQVPGVILDNEEGVRMAVRKLYENGHRDIAYIGGPLGSDNSDHRKKGFFGEMKDLGIKVNPKLVGRADYELDKGRYVMEQFLKTKQSFTAVVTANDRMAVGVCQALQEAGKKVPEDVSVIGFDGTIFADIHRPRLASVAIQGEQMGKNAAEMLISLIGKKKNINTKIITKPEVADGASIKKIN